MSALHSSCMLYYSKQGIEETSIAVTHGLCGRGKEEGERDEEERQREEEGKGQREREIDV